MSFIKTLISSTYDWRMKLSELTGLGVTISENKKKIKPPVDFYSLKAISNSGQEISFEKYRGRKVIIVNLASKCGFTPQYEELEELHQKNKNLVILGFPSNNFGEQEPGSDKEIAQFCKVNYGVSFQLFKKDDVKGRNKQPVFQWLSNENKNGWNTEEPKWNFNKYLVDEGGNLSNVYSSSVSPLKIAL